MHHALMPVMLLLGSWLCPLPALADTEAKPITVYGLFHQTSQGGIVLNCPQEPDVVFLPFDSGAIMRDVLDIQVQVRGEIRDSFVRDGKTVKVLAISAITPMKAEYGATTVTSQTAYGLPGTDPVQIHAYPDRTCYLYDRYAVLERLANYSDGHGLAVLARNAGDNPAAVCETLEGTPLFTIPNGGDFTFAGLTGDTLLVQNGSPKAVHGLMAVNLSQQKQTLNATVVPGSAVTGRTLRYGQTVAGSCPNGATAARPMALDLVTGHGKDIGKTSCWRP
jgi:hypothetical protein